MTDHLQFHKKLTNNKRGFSTVVAAIFMVLAIMFLFFNVFVFVQNQNSKLEDTVSQSAQLDADRLSELISTSASLAPIAIPGTTSCTFQCVFKNNSSLPVKIVRAYWIDTSTNVQTISATIVIAPGANNFNLLSGTSFNSRTVRTVDMYFQVIALVTSRGNVILAKA